MIDEADGPWDTPLPCGDEPALFQRLDHLIHGGWRDEEVASDVYFRRGDTEAQEVPCDELEIFPLTAGGLGTIVGAVASHVRWAKQGCGKALVE
jgi:hypothetical protein